MSVYNEPITKAIPTTFNLYVYIALSTLFNIDAGSLFRSTPGVSRTKIGQSFFES